MNDKLWAMLIPGPDDVWPMPSKEAAEIAAEGHNRIVDADDWPYPELRECQRATVIEWPYDAEAHRDMIESGDAMVLSSNAAGVPDRVAAAMKLTPNTELKDGQ